MLKKENLYVLRELGRKLGVKSPTCKNKDDLIKDIIAVSKGEISPHVQLKGRPALQSEMVDFGVSVKPKLKVESDKVVIDKEFEDKLTLLIRKVLKEEIIELLNSYLKYLKNESI